MKSCKPPSPSADTQSSATLVPNGVLIHLRGCGNLPSFKNSKMIARGRLITDPRKQKIKEGITRDIVAQLRSLFQTIGGETATGCSLQSWMRSVMPQDDSRQWIPELHVYFTETTKGSEGADILIEKL